MNVATLSLPQSLSSEKKVVKQHLGKQNATDLGSYLFNQKSFNFLGMKIFKDNVFSLRYKRVN